MGHDAFSEMTRPGASVLTKRHHFLLPSSDSFTTSNTQSDPSLHRPVHIACIERYWASPDTCRSHFSCACSVSLSAQGSSWLLGIDLAATLGPCFSWLTYRTHEVFPCFETMTGAGRLPSARVMLSLTSNSTFLPSDSHRYFGDKVGQGLFVLIRNMYCHTAHIPPRFQKQLPFQIVQGMICYTTGRGIKKGSVLTNEIEPKNLHVVEYLLHSVHSKTY